MKKFQVLFLLLITVASSVFAQDTLNINGKHYEFISGYADTVKSNGATYIIKYVTEPDMADRLRGNGKIYVVVLVLATIFAGIFAYLLVINRKIKTLEK